MTRARNADDGLGPDDDDEFDGDENLNEDETAEGKDAPERSYPFLNMAAAAGGVVIGTEDRKVVRPMSQHDLMDAAEEQAKVAHRMADAEQHEEKMVGEEKHYKKLLDGARENIRKAQKTQRECGQELKAIAFELETRTRTVTTKVNLTVTAQNEVIIVDAENNQELERRNATGGEIEKSRQRTPSLFTSPPSGTAGGDSAEGKANPEDKYVVLSVSAAGQGKAKKSTREGLAEVPYPGQESSADAECLTVHWSATHPTPGQVAESGRLYAAVPTWAARRLRVVAEGQSKLDLVELPATAG